MSLVMGMWNAVNWIWATTPDSKNVQRCAVSRNGNVMILGDADGDAQGWPSISTDRGLTFLDAAALPLGYWTAVAVAPDGVTMGAIRLVAGVRELWTSSDTGQTWSKNTVVPRGNTLSIGDNSYRLTVGDYNGYATLQQYRTGFGWQTGWLAGYATPAVVCWGGTIYYASSDGIYKGLVAKLPSEQTQKTTCPLTYAVALACTPTGAIVVASNATQGIYISKDAGVTWAKLTGGDGAKSLAISDDGMVIHSGRYISTDQGASWELAPAPGDIGAVAGDGQTALTAKESVQHSVGKRS